MIRKSLLLTAVLYCGSCEEPISFDVPVGEFLVVDAKVSTLPGRSSAYVYSKSLGVPEQGRSDFSVRFIDGDGSYVDLTAGDEIGVYVPVDSCFAGIVGQAYSLYAENPSGLIITSSFDTIPPVVDFQVDFRDTLELVLLESWGVFTETPAKAAFASLQPAEAKYQSRFTFHYEYEHFFSGTNLTVAPIDEFTIFACYDEATCGRRTNLLIATQIDRSWTFWDHTDPRCDSLRQTVEVVENPNGPLAYFIECVAEEQIGIPIGSTDEYVCCCCLETSKYPTDFVITQQSLSNESFRFWKDVDRLLSNNGLVFDTFPFQINSNVKCENCDIDVVGYFSAVGELRRSKEIIF